eukprot:scaffold788_cov56-Attheya_sp.AAC.1
MKLSCYIDRISQEKGGCTKARALLGDEESLLVSDNEYENTLSFKLDDLNSVTTKNPSLPPQGIWAWLDECDDDDDFSLLVSDNESDTTCDLIAKEKIATNIHFASTKKKLFVEDEEDDDDFSLLVSDDESEKMELSYNTLSRNIPVVALRVRLDTSCPRSVRKEYSTQLSTKSDIKQQVIFEGTCTNLQISDPEVDIMSEVLEKLKRAQSHLRMEPSQIRLSKKETDWQDISLEVTEKLERLKKLLYPTNVCESSLVDGECDRSISPTSVRVDLEKMMQSGVAEIGARRSTESWRPSK